MNTNCPCPKVNCSHHGICTECREKHKKSHPYCERTKEEQERLEHAGRKALAIVLPIVIVTLLMIIIGILLLIK